MKKMGLADIVKEELSKAKYFLFTPKSKEDMLEYLKKECSDYFDNLPEEEIKQRYESLKTKLDEKLQKYSQYLGSMTSKAVKAGGILTALSDAYQLFFAKVPLTAEQYVPIHDLMLYAKLVPEAIYMAKYVKDSKDLVGALKWLAMKPIEFAVPIVGPMLGAGWAEKIVRQRVLYEAKKEFLQQYAKAQKANYKTLDEHVAKVTGRPVVPAYSF